jgi:2-polyprenyl-3-methyl-5-hydroxy-6-metoxy-1,4-benzoquinol methylase
MIFFCLVCEKERDFSLWIQKTRNIDSNELYGAASGVSGTQDLAKCSKCKFVMEINRVPKQEILDGYKFSNDSEHDSQFELRIHSFLKTLKKISKSLPKPPATLLDLGCAGGAFIIAAQEFGYDAVGIEPSEYLVSQARIRRNLKVQQGFIKDANQIFEKKFNIVCLWDVLEHTVDPIEALADAISVIEPDGRLIINVPDIGSILARIVGKKNWWISSVHLYHFNKFHLETILNRFNMTLIAQKPYFQSLQLGYLIDIAIQMNMRGANLLNRLLPLKIRKLSIRYYAGQTTFIFAQMR